MERQSISGRQKSTRPGVKKSLGHIMDAEEDVRLTTFRTSPLLDYEKSLEVIKLLRALTNSASAEGAAVYLKTGTVQVLASVNDIELLGKLDASREKKLRDDVLVYSDDTIVFPVCAGSSMIIFGTMKGNFSEDILSDPEFCDLLESVKTEFDIETQAHVLDQYSTIISTKKEKLLRENQYSKNLLNMTTHDLSSPLTAISSYLNLMNDCLKSDRQIDQIDRYHNKIMKGVSYISGIIKQLNEVISLENADKTLELISVDLNWLTEDVCELMNDAAAEKDHLFEFDAYKEPVFVKADVTKLKRVIQNLIINAIKYTPRKGQINVSVGCENDRAFISVKDNGVGIPKDRQEEIFEAYNKLEDINPAENNSASLGLGLFISSYFSRLMNSEIVIDSTPGLGSEFVVEFSEFETEKMIKKQAS